MFVTNVRRFSFPAVSYLAFIASACHHQTNVAAPPFSKIDDRTVSVRDRTHVQTTTLEVKSFPITVDLPGRISIPDANIHSFTSRVQGRIESIAPTVGDRIAKGDILFEIWSPDLANAVEELSLSRKQKSVSLERLSLQKLSAMGLTADDARPGQRSFAIRSPISGVVMDRKINAGAAVSPGDLVLTIGKLDAYQFQGELTPEQALRVQQGMKVAFEDHPNIAATVQSVSPVADATTRLVRVRCSFDSGDPHLPHETLLKAKVTIRYTQSLIAPIKSVVLTNDGEYVFVQNPKDKTVFKKLKIRPESRTGRDIAVEQDELLVPGAEIVSDGALLLNDVLE